MFDPQRQQVEMSNTLYEVFMMHVTNCAAEENLYMYTEVKK